ncbi:MAG: efflux RND transporter permease subunit [Bryobacteraceae bacterium]|nr:efflux RND transporter permease subunit [Bryobacteraceae bacterium]
MQHESDQDIIANTRNTARFFVEQRHVAWVLLLGTMLWGIYGYWNMPQRKDPDIPIREAMAMVEWPGMPAEKVEQLITKKVETTIAQNSKVTEIRSVTHTGKAVIYIQLDERTKDMPKEFDDIKLKLDAIHDLPDGARPIQFIKDFGDTAALMLTVASPPADRVDLELRSRDIHAALEKARGARQGRFSLVVAFPRFEDNAPARRLAREAENAFAQMPGMDDLQVVDGPGFAAIDGRSTKTDAEILGALNAFMHKQSWRAELHPDTWQPFIVRDLNALPSALAAVAGDKYTYRELDQFTDQIEKSLKTVTPVSKVSRSGVVAEQVELIYSQERLASFGVSAAALKQSLSARNIAMPGGTVDVGGRNLTLAPSGEFRNEQEIANMLVLGGGKPAYVRDLAEVQRGYASPARFFHYYNWRDSQGHWRRSRAITLDVQMRSGEQIGAFGTAVDKNLNDVRKRLPADLIMARTSDQPLQVAENVNLFMSSLWEAIALVVLVSLIGFWEWRSAALMAVSIPITLAMTFGMMQLLGVDLQQVSIASLIIALGLLVDDPVVAGDAIKRGLAAGQSPATASWLGPTKLAHAILYATITNIVAYLPFLMLTGDTGRFIYTLPVVITSSLVASRLVSMTFIPLLGYYLLRGRPERRIDQTRGFAAIYRRIGGWAIDHRWAVLASSTAVLAVGFWFGSNLKMQFFPPDLQYLAYVEVWLPEDAPVAATQEATLTAEDIIRKTAKGDVLESLTSWVGGSGPRFWFSAAPEPPQLNYAQILIKSRDKHETSHLLPELQRALNEGVPNARIDVRALETGPVGVPVAIRISGEDIPALREYTSKLKQILRRSPALTRIRDDWGEDTLAVNLKVDADRANLAGLSNYDVANASLSAFTGVPVATLRDGDKNIPVVARLRLEERPQIGNFDNLYVQSSQQTRAVPLRQVASVDYEMQPAKLRRLNQFRTITVSAFAAEGHLASEFLAEFMPEIRTFESNLPPGMKLEIAGEFKEQNKGFKQQGLVMAISVAAIFLALVIQFKHAVKPFIVFAAIPYGIVGSIAALYIMGTPFSFMAFLGIASLVGVIVSHIIVLFDFIEERHQAGAPLREALLDAGIMRLRPVLITVGATVIALFPLASHGGPLWEPLCYTQIGGLTLSTMITLLLVPVVYAIFVLDLKWVKWRSTIHESNANEPVTCALATEA